MPHITSPYLFAQSSTSVDLSPVLDFSGYVIYAGLAAVALYGVFCVILLARRIAQKRFASPEAANQFLEEVRDRLRQGNDAGVVELCDSPPYWSKATPQLMLLALAHRGAGTNKLRRMLAERFESDVLADIEYRMSWISAIVKTGPMLGLLGTVVGMISAFSGIAEIQEMGGVSKQLASDISFALFTTMYGLMIAIPLVLAGNMIHVRIGKLQDSVQQQLGAFLDDLEKSAPPAERRQA